MEKIEAVVLALQKYNDTSSILHVYTREFGRMQYIVYGKKNLLFPLAWIEIITQSKNSSSLPVIRSANLHYIPRKCFSQYHRQCIALFIAEALYKTLKHPMQDVQVFEYITDCVKELDLSDSVEHLPKEFLNRLSSLLGFGGEPIEGLEDMQSAFLISPIL